MNKEDALLDFLRALLQDEKFTRQDNWQKLIFIGEFEEDNTGMFGYSYDALGSCMPVAPSLSFDDDKFRVLHDAMKSEDPKGKGWIKCMIRISRTGKFGADFEYNDPERWKRTIDNTEERMKEYANLPV